MTVHSARLLGIVLLGLSCAATAGPFGLEMGMPLAKIGGNPKHHPNGMYAITTVPKPHSAFESYFVQVAPKAGLCFAKGIGHDIETDDGGAVRAAFNDMAAKLTTLYGKPMKIDELQAGSTNTGEDAWMPALVAKERILTFIWDADSGANLPSDLRMVGLVATAVAPEKGYIVVEYGFANEPECEEELKSVEDDAL